LSCQKLKIYLPHSYPSTIQRDNSSTDNANTMWCKRPLAGTRYVQERTTQSLKSAQNIFTSVVQKHSHGGEFKKYVLVKVMFNLF
jgi:hypothetical protein